MIREVDGKAMRTTISITPEVYAKAKDVMKARSFSKFSGLLHQLIREEWDRRHGPEVIARNLPGRRAEPPMPPGGPSKIPRRKIRN